MTGLGRTVFHNPWNDYHTPTITPQEPYTGKASLITHPIIPQSTNSTAQSCAPARTVHNCTHVHALWALSALRTHRAQLSTRASTVHGVAIADNCLQCLRLLTLCTWCAVLTMHACAHSAHHAYHACTCAQRCAHASIVCRNAHVHGLCMVHHGHSVGLCVIFLGDDYVIEVMMSTLHMMMVSVNRGMNTQFSMTPPALILRNLMFHQRCPRIGMGNRSGTPAVVKQSPMS